ncbi:hypothetical protein [Paracoccus sp. (in: a-proteobacteria)]|uniref:hypothetical protein n=1 Tax=Paracoccus sp. TaxID=267 RepID=UPI00272C07CE|nr:hypothetical protein [Paracoccus sp. (in: a-proteobacteria)]
MTEEETTVAAENREPARALARAIWAVTKRPAKAVEGAEEADATEEPSGEEANAAWQADKTDMMRTARKVLRRLEAKGFTVVQK